MSYKDPRTGEWLPGTPPRGVDAVYLNSKGDVPTAAELRASEVAMEAADLADLAPGSAWATETQACVALSIDARELYSDAELIAGCHLDQRLGELVFDAVAVAKRLTKPKAADADEVAESANALLAELREQGLDNGGLLGGGA